VDKLIDLLVSRPLQPPVVRRVIYVAFLIILVFSLLIIFWEMVLQKPFFPKEGIASSLMTTLLMGLAVLSVIAFAQEWTAKEKIRLEMQRTLDNMLSSFKFKDEYIERRDILRVFEELRTIVRSSDTRTFMTDLDERIKGAEEKATKSNLAADWAQIDHLRCIRLAIDVLGLESDERKKVFLTLEAPTVVPLSAGGEQLSA